MTEDEAIGRGEPKIRVEGLKKHFLSNDDLLSRLNPWEGDRHVKAVDGVDLEIYPGEALGIAGESGCGKSTLGKTLLQLTEATEGSIYFNGVDITENVDEFGGENAFRREAQIIHQDPYKSINPRFTVFKWVKEPLDIHNRGSREEKEAHVMDTLERVGLRPADTYAAEYPSELSGGERQRVGIARAIVLEPSFLVADEPASMLDVSIRASILELLENLQETMGLATLYISHDLSLLKHMCDRLSIMYLGQIVETGGAEEVIDDPKHPYTQAMVASTPIIDPKVERQRIELEGEVPDPIDPPTGCRFHPRCREVIQPKGYDLDQPEWRRVVRLGDRLRAGEVDLEEIDEDVDRDDSSAVARELREVNEIPATLSDSEAEAAITQVLETAAEGEFETALDRLDEAFPTPCIRHDPRFRDSDGRTLACHLHDPLFEDGSVHGSDPATPGGGDDGTTANADD